MLRNRLAPLLVLVGLASGCRLDQSGVPRDAGLDGQVVPDASVIPDAQATPDAVAPDAQVPPDAVVPDAQAPDAGPLVVASEAHVYPVPPSPPNPVTGEEAPPEMERIRVVRYFAENPVRPTQAIVLAYPGAQLGAGSYAHLARNLILRSQGAIELWSYERRGNAIEDRTGLDAAPVDGNLDRALGYYFDGLEIDGRTFSGVVPTDGPSYASEWGMVQEVADLAMVLGFVEQASRRSHVVLLGFSLGAPVVSQFAAWDFAGRKGADDLAGVVMLDGGGLRRSLTEQEFHEVGCLGSLGLPIGLDALRSTGPYFQDLGVGAGIWLTMELSALHASGLYGDPTAELTDPAVQQLVGLFMERPGLRVTGRAAFGLVIDDQFSPALVMRAGLGFPTGGAVEPYVNSIAGETLLRPSDASALYGWQDFDEVDPPELTSLTDAARLIGTGPTGALEWYTPLRLNLDVCAADGLDVSDAGGDYRWDLGLRVTRNAEMDAPVLFFFAEYGEIWDLDFVEDYRQSLPPVGAGRPNAGAGRDLSLPTHQTGFALVMAPGFRHIDCVLAAPEAGATYLYEPLVDFVLANTTGTVSAVLPD